MNTLFRSLLIATAIIIAGLATASAETSSAPRRSSGITDAKHISMQAVREPIQMTAEDLVTKVYGIFDADLSQSQVVEYVNLLKLNPSVDATHLWLDSTDGFTVSYNGMTPSVAAYATFEDEAVSGYSFFFIFPYESGTHKSVANDNQCQFCSSLLQELNDMGADMRAGDSSETIFNAAGSYGLSNLNISLIDDGVADNSGRYILILEVEPNAFSPADEIPAFDDMMAEAF